MALTNLTKEQNKELESMHIQAINEAERLLKIYRMSNLRKYLTLTKCELAKAKAYWELGNFEKDPRFHE